MTRNECMRDADLRMRNPLLSGQQRRLQTIRNRTDMEIKNDFHIELPEDVTEIDSSAFINCTALQKVHFPQSLDSIGYQAFKGCTKLETISLPDCLRTIGDYSFSDCDALKTLEVPDSVTETGSPV